MRLPGLPASPHAHAGGPPRLQPPTSSLSLPAGDLGLGQLFGCLPALRCLETDGNVRRWGDLWTAGAGLTRLAIKNVWDFVELPPVPPGGALPALRELVFDSGSECLPALPAGIFAATPGLTALELRSFGEGLWLDDDHALFIARATEASARLHARCPAAAPRCAACRRVPGPCGRFIAWLTRPPCPGLPALPAAHLPRAPEAGLRQAADPARRLPRDG